MSNGQFWYKNIIDSNSFLYKKKIGSGNTLSTKFAPGGNLITNTYQYLYNKYKPNSNGVGASTISNRRAKNRLASICEIKKMNKQTCITGKVQSGLQNDVMLLNNYTVYLYKVNDTNPILSSVTNISGVFNMCIDIEHFNSILYLVAENNNKNIKLLFILQSSPIIINEVSSICAIYAFSQFYTNGYITGNNKSLTTASHFDLSCGGDFSIVLKTSPNGNQTNSWQILTNLSNLFGSSIRNQTCYSQLVSLTTEKITNTLDYFHYITQNPANNVTAIYNLSTSYFILYTNTLISIPDAFTVVIKFNNSGSNEYMFGGPGNLVFDKNGYAWITNNVVQGTPDSSNFAIVLKPNGQPSNMSPLFGGGILGSGFGVATSKDKSRICITNFGWGNLFPTPQGSLSLFNINGVALTPSASGSNTGGYIKDTYRVQGVKFDGNNNIWMASYGNDRVVVYLNGDENNSTYKQFEEYATPFDVAIDSNNYAVVSLQGNQQFGTSQVLSKLVKLYLDQNNNIQIYFTHTMPIYTDKLLGISIDSNNNIFANSYSIDCVYKFDPEGNLLNTITGGGIHTPWGSHIDGNNNLLVANFYPNTDDNYGISYFDNNGIAKSPSKGFTVKSGGDQVLMANGEPLYGYSGVPSYNPIMRQTGINVDCAGNVWVCNNWKPSLINDIRNPGADGVVVFIGLASPLYL